MSSIAKLKQALALPTAATRATRKAFEEFDSHDCHASEEDGCDSPAHKAEIDTD